MRLLLLLVMLQASVAAAGNIKPLPPRYQAPAQTGVIRIWGHASMADIVKRWQAAYVSSHAELRFETHLSGSDIGMAGLYTGQADLVLMGRTATAPELQAFEWVYQYKPSRIEVLTGSYDRPGRAAALAVLVNRSNPLESLNLQQLKTFFNNHKQQSGATIETWGQLGLSGSWQDQPIRLYSLDTDAGSGRYFREKVLGNSRSLNWDRLQEFKATPADDGPALATANRKLLTALQSDRYGLAVATADPTASGTKALALAPCKSCEPVAISDASVASRLYPLARGVSAYYNKPPDQPDDPVLMAFLTYVLSQEGQAAIIHADGYFPLNPLNKNVQTEGMK